LKIEFTLNEAQSKVLEDLLKLPVNKDKTANEVCRIYMVQGLIQVKQQMIAQELS
jgi:hypothetical protein